jgi:hypothetical protein
MAEEALEVVSAFLCSLLLSVVVSILRILLYHESPPLVYLSRSAAVIEGQAEDTFGQKNGFLGTCLKAGTCGILF